MADVYGRCPGGVEMKNIITCLAVCALSGVVAAEVHHVPADFPTIQYAVNAAVDGDEIIVMPGTYTSTANEVVNMKGKAVWLHSSGGQEAAITDGQGLLRGILCDSGETLKTNIKGLTNTNGYAHVGSGMYSTSSSNPTVENYTFTGNCAATPTTEVVNRVKRMLVDGTWEESRSQNLSNRGIQYVRTTIHIVRYSDGSGGLPESYAMMALDDINSHIAETGLVFCLQGDIIYIDSDDFAVLDDAEINLLRQYDPVANTMNVWFVPDFVNNYCTSNSYPSSSVQGIVIKNTCGPPYTRSIFSDSVGHYFGLYHTHETYFGDECVDGSNCEVAGDLICDTPADPGLAGNVDGTCSYIGTVVDSCNGDTYSPLTDNLMAYATYTNHACRDKFSQEQLSVFLWTAENEREDHLSSLPCEGPLICEPLLTPGCVLTTKASNSGEFSVYEPDMNNDSCWLRGTISLGFVPAGIEIGPNGNIFVWEQNQGPLHEYSGETGEYVQAFISGDTGLHGRGFCFMQNGDVLVSGGVYSEVARFDGTTGEYIGDFVAAGSGGLSVCFGVDIGPNNNVFACSLKTNQIIQYDGITGDFIGIYASVLSPYDLTFAPDGTLFVTTYEDGNIYKFASDGFPLGQFNDINISPARGIDIGTDGDVYVACWDDHAGFMAGAYRFDGITGELKESLPQPSAIFCCVNGEPNTVSVWTVDDDGPADFDNIQAAVDASSVGDEILVMPGTYTSGGDEVVDMLGKEVWLHSSAGAGVTIIDGDGTRRGVNCRNNETSNTIIEGFTITNCYANTSGGGMYNWQSSSTLIDCTFTNNTANNEGGGMYNYSSSPTLTDCTFTGNSANDDGGGMRNYSSNPSLTNCTFTNNTADYGGGMRNYSSSPTLTGCTFESNTAEYGGGMRNDTSSSPTLTGCTFTKNTANADGGGMYSIESSGTLENCTFTYNISIDDGAGAYFYSSDSVLTNCVFDSNSSIDEAGGLFSDQSDLVMNYCTFTNNSGDHGGALYCWDSSPIIKNSNFTNNIANYGGALRCKSNSNPTLENCTLMSNTANYDGGGMYNTSDSIPALVYTLVCANNPNQIVGPWTDGGGNTIVDECPECPDINGDDIVDVSDLLIVIGYWGSTDSPADVNDDGIVNVSDLLLIISNWGPCE